MVLTGSIGKVSKGEPKETEVRLTGIQPLLSTFLKLAEVAHLYDQPAGRAGRPRLAQPESLSGIDTYTVFPTPNEEPPSDK